MLLPPKDEAVKGEVGKLLPIPDEFKEVQVIAYFILERPEGKKVETAKTISVTVYKDAKIEAPGRGKRIPIKTGDIKSGQRIELYDLAEVVRIGDSMRIAANSIIVEEQGK